MMLSYRGRRQFSESLVIEPGATEKAVWIAGPEGMTAV